MVQGLEHSPRGRPYGHGLSADVTVARDDRPTPGQVREGEVSSHRRSAGTGAGIRNVKGQSERLASDHVLSHYQRRVDVICNNHISVSPGSIEDRGFGKAAAEPRES